MNWLQRIANNNSEELESIREKWQLQVPGLVLYVYERDNRIVLDSLIVPRDHRKQGIGSLIMQDLVNFSDRAGKRLELSPGQKDSYHGTTSKRRLIDFYKRFGLVLNKGRNKDYSTTNTMYREPRVVQQPHPQGVGIVPKQ